jgi:transcriptional regulator with XRE-family HTH domain
MSIAHDLRRRPQFGLTHRLVLAREVADLDQAAIADALGVSRQTVSNYERGFTKPRKLVLKEWALVTGVDLGWLTTGQEEDESPSGPGGSTGDEGQRSSEVHPLGLEPRTHWLRVSGDLAPVTPLRQVA